MAIRARESESTARESQKVERHSLNGGADRRPISPAVPTHGDIFITSTMILANLSIIGYSDFKQSNPIVSRGDMRKPGV